MPHGKDDNENKGRKSGKGPKLSKGMKKAARQEKKTARKTARKTKKVIKKLAKAVSKDFKKNIPTGMTKEGVTRFVGSQPVIKHNLVEKIKPIGPAPKAISAKPIKKKN